MFLPRRMPGDLAWVPWRAGCWCRQPRAGPVPGRQASLKYQPLLLLLHTQPSWPVLSDLFSDGAISLLLKPPLVRNQCEFCGKRWCRGSGCWWPPSSPPSPCSLPTLLTCSPCKRAGGAAGPSPPPTIVGDTDQKVRSAGQCRQCMMTMVTRCKESRNQMKSIWSPLQVPMLNHEVWGPGGISIKF